MTGVWNDAMLMDAGRNGLVTPYDPELVNPASIDLRLGNTMRRADPLYRHMQHDDMRHIIKEEGEWVFPTWGEPFEFETAWIMPGEFVLCHSLEYVRIPTNASALLFSKSSMGRIGLEHSHAGLGDPNFNGQWTWEWSNIAPWPIQIVAGKRYMQMQLYSMAAAPLRSYAVTGRYQGQTGPTPSRGRQRWDFHTPAQLMMSLRYYALLPPRIMAIYQPVTISALHHRAARHIRRFVAC